MPATPTYPGVYIEELPSAVRTITAVSTSVTAFVGFTQRGPLDTPVVLTSFADYERRFGGLSPDSVLGYSVQQFFLNGGSTAIVVRLAAGAAASKVTLQGGGAGVLTVTAKEPGIWSDGLRVRVDNDPSGPDAFSLRITDLAGTVAESYRTLSMKKADPRYVGSVVNGTSALVTVQVLGDNPVPPDPSGTVSKDFADPLPDLNKDVEVEIGDGHGQFTLFEPEHDGAVPKTMTQLALLLERKLRQSAATVAKTAPAAAPAFARAQVQAVGRKLQVIAGVPDATVRFTGTGAGDLGLEGSARPTAYPLAGGADGTAPQSPDFVGSAADKTGINALRDVDDVNLLCLPEVAGFDTDELVGVLAEAERLCVDKRMLLLVDPPSTWTSLDAVRAHLPELDSLRSSYAALYLPGIEITDPLTGRLKTLPPSGAVAGVMARTDAERGVWKAPAGTEARLTGVRALTVPLTDPENGLLNPLGVNCLRVFPIVGPVVWGARTLEGADALASQWKYVPVRRLALMIEESLYRGTKWVVFEPNDERLWGQIRLNVGAFMQTLFRQGAFQGASAREAYFVKCDKDTTTQDDINRGVVNILVGFAPLKPAEFVIVKIEQLAGQIEV
jgi:phage tail sheath protein FI